MDELIHYNFSWLCVGWLAFFPDLMFIYEKIAAEKILYFASKVVYMKCLDSVNVCISDGYYYYKCDLFSGCENYVGQKAYGFVC